MEDCELLREYVANQSEAAFAELVRRHVALVHSTALRLVGEAQMAKDISQSVFLRLARKAGSVRDGNALDDRLFGRRAGQLPRAREAVWRGSGRDLAQGETRNTLRSRAANFNLVLDKNSNKIMKTKHQPGNLPFDILLLAALLTVAGAGCGKQNTPSGTAARATPLEKAVASWHQGDQAGAVQRFLEIDWKTGAPYSAGSPLRMREKDFPSLSAAESEKLMGQVTAQLKDLKQLATAVRDKGLAATAADRELARRCFGRIDECGAALDQPDGLKIVQLVGQALRKMAAAESAKLGQ